MATDRYHGPLAHVYTSAQDYRHYERQLRRLSVLFDCTVPRSLASRARFLLDFKIRTPSPGRTEAMLYPTI